MLNFYRSVKSGNLNQPFGFNLSWAKLGPDGQPIRPYVISSAPVCPPGYVSFYKLLDMLGHNGRDWAAYHGEPVYFGVTKDDLSPLEGTCYTEVDPDGGKGVNILFEDEGTFSCFQVKLWHLLDFAVHDGQKVKSGDLIGYADSSGASSGDHLHEGLKPLWTMKLEDKKYPNNGYTGAVDPGSCPGIKDYQASSFILEVLNLKQQLTLLQKLYKLLLQIKGRST